MLTIILRTIICSTLLIHSLSFAATKSPLIAILTPTSVEGQPILAAMQHKKVISQHGMTLTTGTLANNRVVHAFTGIGKVNAAVATANVINTFHPQVIILSGIAGAVNTDLRPCDVVI